MNKSKPIVTSCSNFPGMRRAGSCPEIVAVASMDGVQVVEGHVCAYGLPVVSTSGCAKVVRKPTGWMTSSSCFPVAWSHRCDNEKCHAREIMNTRRRAGETPPLKLVT